MGQNASCACADEHLVLDETDYVDLPLITKEDVNYIKACFEYLQPQRGVVQRRSIQAYRQQAPAYMLELVEALAERGQDVSFDEFYKIMKPKIIQMKAMPRDSVVLEATSTSVSCLLCPYTRGGAQGNGWSAAGTAE